MSWTISPKYKDPNFSNVSLLLHGNGVNGSTTITDNSPTPKTVTAVGNAQISTAQSKFGGSSIAFDGTGDYLVIPSNADFNFGSDNFTIEAWVYTNNSTPRVCQFSANSPPGDQTSGPGIYSESGKWGLYYANTYTTSTASVALSTWTHVAVVRNGGQHLLFVDGSLAHAVTTSPMYAAQALTIGLNYSAAFAHNGYIDELRVTKGVARYTSNFSVPSAPFPDI